MSIQSLTLISENQVSAAVTEYLVELLLHQYLSKGVRMLFVNFMNDMHKMAHDLFHNSATFLY